MPQVTAEIFVPLEPAVAFAVSQTTGPIRLRWDPFLRHQYFLDGATAADQGGPHLQPGASRTPDDQPLGLLPSSHLGGETIVSRPWFFASLGGGWRFEPEDCDGVAGTRATWKYTWRGWCYLGTPGLWPADPRAVAGFGAPPAATPMGPCTRPIFASSVSSASNQSMGGDGLESVIAGNLAGATAAGGTAGTVGGRGRSAV